MNRRTRKTALRRRKNGHGPPGMTTFERISINISGEVFETYFLTLLRFPDTLLGDLRQLGQFYCSTSNQYFFDRNRPCFGAILFFYQSNGTLRCPPGVSLDVFETECKFFQLPELFIYRMKIKGGIIPNLDQVSDPEDTTGMPAWKLKIWNLLESPESSSAANIRKFAIIGNGAILLSTIVASLKTISQLDFIPWSVVELTLNCWFLVELFLRFASCPSKRIFLKKKLNWVDFFAVIPYFVITLPLGEANIRSLGFFRILRFVRVIRLFRLSKHSKRLKVVAHILKSSFEDFQMLLSCLGMLIVVYASIMYYVECTNHWKTDFRSVPASLWWAVQTITTVGYGDMIPSTLAGKFLSAVLMAFGALTVSLPVLSIVTKFTNLYMKNIDTDRFNADCVL